MLCLIEKFDAGTLVFRPFGVSTVDGIVSLVDVCLGDSILIQEEA